MSPLLEVRGLTVSYGKIEAVHGVDLTVTAGSIVTVIGPNGAGKTTLLNAVLGLLQRGGRVRHLGEELRGSEVEGAVARGLMLVPDQRELVR